MCGIALILSGVDVVGCDLYRESDGPPSTDAEEMINDNCLSFWIFCQPALVVGDLKDAIGRRGPDSLGVRKVFVQLKQTDSVGKDDDKEYTEEDLHICYEENANNNISSIFKVSNVQDNIINRWFAELYFLGATLQLRGASPIFQPLVDSSGNILVYNGEIFGGIHVSDDKNDAETLLHVLESCCCCNGSECGKVCYCTKLGAQFIPEIISKIKGPWALIYWQRKSGTLWFGRDAFGRRSLLVHWPTMGDARFVLSSVSPALTIGKNSDTEVECSSSNMCYWEELPCGIYSLRLKAPNASEQLVKQKLVGEIRKHKWTDPLLNRLVEWERTCLDPKVDPFFSNNLQLQRDHLALSSNSPKGVHKEVARMELEEHRSDIHNHIPGDARPAVKVLNALKESVMRRTVSRIFQRPRHEDEMDDHSPIAILFSGGLDSMILAAILDQCIDSKYTIDLLNVSFDGQLAPDRVSARAGVAELQNVAPHRRPCCPSGYNWIYHWDLLPDDLNIGIALWLAAGGDGWVDGGHCKLHNNHQRYRYKSTARILLVGSGADEQCAGYGRHRTKYRLGGWVALHEEMRLDVQRIWKRNMGRDDRCISDHGKEARFPFLDEDVIKTLLDFPLWEIAELDKPAGIGDKKILREVSWLLGLKQAAEMPKRAIQFGSRIARESNRKNFGSNRAANQVSAGSVEIHHSLS
ncbi:hypothetical protein C4D60_Mb06t31540 [Musa balbisiana]|uniref:Glutamine amidotransferase type-2 domain-containing protein n=1 Tax=Musa balbisiana TaxID=52838 RepID=A0A4V4H4C2_MUSBA|nr:hypothetical protein C4D60_Mb06t31540 [Musa balbisiana]